VTAERKGKVIGSHERAEIQLEADDKAKERVLQKIDDLIWRRKLQDKPYDQLEEIREEVENL
jgi:hypothetical protein